MTYGSTATHNGRKDKDGGSRGKPDCKPVPFTQVLTGSFRGGTGLSLHYLDVPRDVWLSIEALVAVLIGAIAYEDGMGKSAPATINAGSVESMTTNTTEVAKDS